MGYDRGMARTGARPGDWKTTPLPALREVLDLRRTFTADEARRLREGLVPEAMEDKWFIVWEDEALWFYRSWTGLCVFRVGLVADGDGVAIGEVLVNRDPQHYRGQTPGDQLLLEQLLRSLLEFSDRRGR